MLAGPARARSGAMPAPSPARGLARAAHASLAETLRAGREITLRGGGRSMAPTIRPGAAVSLGPCDTARLAVGDIVAAVVGERIVIHRIVELDAHVVVLRGDNSARADRVSRPAVLAAVTAVDGEAPRPAPPVPEQQRLALG